MEKLSTHNKEESASFPRDLVERLLYGLTTLAFCAVPFLIPGITIRQGGIVFFGEVMTLILGIFIFGVVINRKKTQKRSRR